MTRYLVRVAEALLRPDSGYLPLDLPDCVRFVETGALSEDGHTRTMTVEDDEAPDFLDGLLVDITFQSHYDDAGRLTKTTVMSRSVVDEPWMA